MDMTEQFKQIRIESEKEHVYSLISDAIHQQGSVGHNHARIPVDLTQFPEIKSSLEEAGYEIVQFMVNSFELIW